MSLVIPKLGPVSSGTSDRQTLWFDLSGWCESVDLTDVAVAEADAGNQLGIANDVINTVNHTANDETAVANKSVVFTVQPTTAGLETTVDIRIAATKEGGDNQTFKAQVEVKGAI